MSCSIEEAHSILASVRNGRITPYDLFPQGDYKDIRDISVAELCKQYGSSYDNYLGQVAQTNRVRQACVETIVRMQTAPTFPMMLPLACYVMGSNRCDELSTATLVEGVARGKTVARVVVTDSKDSNKVNHGFVICGEFSETFKNLLQNSERKIKITEMAALCPQAMVMDPFLNVAFPMREFTGSVLDDYCQKCGIIEVFQIAIAPTSSSLEEGQKVKSRLMQQAEAIKRVAESLKIGL